MNSKTEMSALQQAESGAHEQQKSEAPNVDHVPGKLTFAQNIIGTIKILAIAGLVIAALWGLDLWTSSKH